MGSQRRRDTRPHPKTEARSTSARRLELSVLARSVLSARGDGQASPRLLRDTVLDRRTQRHVLPHAVVRGGAGLARTDAERFRLRANRRRAVDRHGARCLWLRSRPARRLQRSLFASNAARMGAQDFRGGGPAERFTFISTMAKRARCRPAPSSWQNCCDHRVP